MDPHLVNQLQNASFLDLERETAIPMSTSLGAGAPHADVSCFNYVTANLTLYSFGLVSQQQLGILVNQVLQMLSCHLCGMSTSWEL